jgi:hypothetical protein
MGIERYKRDIERLIAKGDLLYAAMVLEEHPEKKKGIPEEQLKSLPKFRIDYQTWYSEALSCVSQLLPDRLDDFISHYKPLKPRKEILASNYTVSDYLPGISVTRGAASVVSPDAAIPQFQQQLNIVKAIRQRFESSLFDIRALVQAEFFDDELDVATELSKNGFSRAAGAVAGVVLEGHLAEICVRHGLSVSKNPSLSDLYDKLKKAEIIDTPTWRAIQHLGDIRNLCDHKKTKEPTQSDVAGLIDGTRKIIKTVF